jgi:chromosome segregation protein
MSSFIKTNSCRKVETKCVSGTLYSPKGDKDTIINNLNSRITQLEQGEKDFDLLNQELKQLENDISLLNEAKLRLEYEIKQRDEAYTKRIQDLKSDKDNLQNALKDKNCVNKKLMEEKDCLENQLKNKDDEIDDLNNKINDLNSKLGDNENNKDGLGNLLKNLNSEKNEQKYQIEELSNDNKKLAQICQEQDHKLYLAGQEKAHLSKKLGDDKASINNLNSKIRIHENNLANLQNQIDKSNELNVKLQTDLQNLENRLAEERVNNDNLREGLMQERDFFDCEEQKFSELSCISCDRKNKIKCLNNDYERMKIAHQKMIEINGIYNIEKNKLRDHIMKLNTQNQDLSTEIENVIKDDEHMKNVLARNERMSFTLSENDSILSQLPNDIICQKFCIPENKNCCPYEENRLCYNQNNNSKKRNGPKMNIYNKK